MKAILPYNDEIQNICSILVDSMPTRISMIINGKGERIKNYKCFVAIIWVNYTFLGNFCDFSVFFSLSQLIHTLLYNRNSILAIRFHNKRINDPWKSFLKQRGYFRGSVPVTFCRLDLFD